MRRGSRLQTYGASQAAYPSRLRASGRNLVDENNYVMPCLRGENVHNVPWSQSHFDAMAALGMTIVRVIILWNNWQPTDGVTISATQQSNMDLTVARAQAAGMYVLPEIHLNTGAYPAWANSTTDQTQKLVNHGQFLVEYLYNRYGNPADPTAAGKYTKAVIGLGVNEPPIDDSTVRNGNASNTWVEDRLKIIHGWHRAIGSNWIAVVSTGYAAQTPIYDNAIGQNSSGAAANPSTYASIGGNIVYDIHMYFARDIREANNPTQDGRQFNGQTYPVSTYSGGNWTVGSLVGVDKEDYVSSAVHKAQQVKFLAPFATMSANFNVPVMIGEWGYPQTLTADGQPNSGGVAQGEAAYIADLMAAWQTLGATGHGGVAQLNWNYDVTPANTKWCARPNSVWRSSVTTWMAT